MGAVLVLWVWCLGMLAGARAAEPLPTEPMLRVETGGHTAMIHRVGVDRAGRWLVTGSDDKTVRVWDLETGALVRTIRMPAGTATGGEVFAVALSPDGATIAVGGTTADEDDGESVYLFATATGVMLRRITNVPGGILDLAFSADGTELAATGHESAGVRLFQVQDGRLLRADSEFGDDCYGVDVDRDGRIAVVSLDGDLRLYNRGLKLGKRVHLRGGTQPYAVSFSPDGAEVAVGYADAPRVDVYSATTATLLRTLQGKGGDDSGLASIAWTQDGRTLYGAGLIRDSTDRLIVRRWGDAGRGAAVDIPVADDTITDLAVLPTGDVVMATGEPRWMVLGAGGRMVREVAPLTATVLDAPDQLRVDETGALIAFAYRLAGGKPASFSTTDRALRLGSITREPLRSPATSSGGRTVEGWQDSREPSIGKTPLALDKLERSASLAFSPAGDWLTLGAEWSLRRFDTKGALTWSVPVPGTAWAVNITGDGKRVVAALGDGTIRWYRASDGEELLAFFPHADQKRWVLWTPSGYYDASPGGEDLIGWQVNRGKDAAADFFPASRFRDRFYRPDVVSRVLDTLDEAGALAAANVALGRTPTAAPADIRASLPPVVSILSPAGGTSVAPGALQVQVRVRSPSGKAITAVRALVDGRPAEASRGLEVVPEAGGQTFTLTVTAPDHDFTLGVLAEAGDAIGEPESVAIKVTRPSVDLLKPKLYVLAIGVSTYADSTLRLKYAAQDAKDLVAMVQAHSSGLYRAVEVRTITDADATKDGILDGLDWIRSQTTARDVALVFIAGHGINDPATGRYYFLPTNADAGAKMRTMLPESDIQDTLKSIPGKVLLFLDTCHAGNVTRSETAVALRGGSETDRFVNELASAENGVVVFTAATGRQSSQEADLWKNGAFTEALLEGLGGRADLNRNGAVTITELDAYISDRVKTLTKGEQAPSTVKPGAVGDFPIVLVAK